ncbi:MAG: hypothetical protein ACMUIE_05895 [Thermoplasmatota archaeon]
MEYFDGSAEQFQLRYGDWSRTRKVKDSFKAGVGIWKYLWHYMKATLIIIALCFIPIMALMSPLFLIGMDLVNGLLAVLSASLCLAGLFGIPALFMVFVLYLIQGRKLLKGSSTVLTDNSVEITYQDNSRNPLQKTIVPFQLIAGIRDVSDVEWKEDLRMKNLFRLVFNMPKKRCFNRFQAGSSKRTILAIDLFNPVATRKYRIITGTMGRWGGALISPLIAALDQQMVEDKEPTNRIFVSVPKGRVEEFKRKLTESNSSFSEEDEWLKEAQEPVVPEIDDSFMDLIYGNNPQ